MVWGQWPNKIHLLLNSSNLMCLCSMHDYISQLNIDTKIAVLHFDIERVVKSSPLVMQDNKMLEIHINLSLKGF